MTETDLTQEHLAADAEFAAFGWSPAELNVADDAGVKQTLSGYTRDGLGTAWTPEGWTLWALTANLTGSLHLIQVLS